MKHTTNFLGTILLLGLFNFSHAQAKFPLVCKAADGVRSLEFDLDTANRLIATKKGQSPDMFDGEQPNAYTSSTIRINQILPLNFDCVLRSDDEDVFGIRKFYFVNPNEKYLAIWKVEGTQIPCTYDIITYDGVKGQGLWKVHTGLGKGPSEIYECKHHVYGEIKN